MTTPGQRQQILDALLGKIVAGVEHKDLLIFVERSLQVALCLEVGGALQGDADLLSPLDFNLLLSSAHAEHQRED